MSYSRSLKRKNVVYVMTLVDRSTRCILAWAVDTQRTVETLQQMVDTAPQAAYYFAAYRTLIYAPGRYTPMPDKRET